MNRYQRKLDEKRELVRKGVGEFNSIASDVNYGGPVIVEYMYDVYCESKVLALIGSKALNWKEAIEEEVEITYKEFKENWLSWANEHFRL